MELAVGKVKRVYEALLTDASVLMVAASARPGLKLAQIIKKAINSLRKSALICFFI